MAADEEARREAAEDEFMKVVDQVATLPAPPEEPAEKYHQRVRTPPPRPAQLHVQGAEKFLMSPTPAATKHPHDALLRHPPASSQHAPTSLRALAREPFPTSPCAPVTPQPVEPAHRHCNDANSGSEVRTVTAFLMGRPSGDMSP